jgi:UDP-N-acetylmuramyl pentapeptide phosphotransferase/UDP-N-acetylglucosamine-1-phosphate transferase
VLLDLAIVMLVSLAASALACRLVIWTGPVDHPSEARKQHRVATPTSGGLGVGLGYAIGLALLTFVSTVWRYEVHPLGLRMLWASAAFAYPLLIIGFIDDVWHLGARLKFVLYSAIALGAAYVIGVVNVFPVTQDLTLFLPFEAALVGTALWVFTMINCVNFMDGSNGLALGSVGVALLALAAISLAEGAPSGSAISLCGAGAMLGFLVWNFPNGKLFAGDAGALFGGALGAFASMIVIARADISPFVPPILFFPLLADALLTLFWRWRAGRPLLVAHAEHHYQLGIRGGLSHARVAMIYWLATAACGVLGFFVSREADPAAEWIALIALSLLAITCSSFVRRWGADRNLLST